MSRIFARALTKDYLKKHGVREITKDCKVIFEDGRVLEKEEDFTKDKLGYFSFNVYELDENGNRIRIPITKRYKYKGYEKLYNTYKYKYRTIYLHRAVYVWFNNEIPEGLIIDHIFNKHDTLSDNRIENLQLLSQGEHARKDKPLSTRELRCNMTLPLSYYEEKLNTYLNEYNNTKDQKEKRNLSTQICQYKAKIRYWKSHEEEYIKIEEINAIEANALKAKKDKALKAQKERTKELKQYQKLIDEARELYKQDPSSDNNYNWRLAINNYNEYVKTHPFKTQKQLFAEFYNDQVLN